MTDQESSPESGARKVFALMSLEELTRYYWRLKDEVRRDEGRLFEAQAILLLMHNILWK